MSGNKFLLDTNAVLYILNGDEVLAELLYEKRLYVSIITEMELLSYKNITVKEKQQIKNFLSAFVIINIDNVIKDQAIETKKNSYLKLPDSIIAATAIILDIPLVSSDKQFKTVTNLNFLLYEK
ncbi:type II toxin-antitoxin system VapC family toxin [Arachidicoccus soli]|uniref:Type II toxin-antitoxin system VapC family toxin n=1 Tax=Arachidicoccus soli TaxID=2341117 RepID=A0A386HRK3_9BACT|nr:type II toxin-antitoxin system VapC family toxin [Arachidicoccus soli]AYD48413.1 type II toxin-antitoxin system VapC family toxin [Arachidicoccus soli]